MNAELEKYRLMDEYLKNKLSGKDLMEFEENLKQNADLQEELKDLKLTNEVIVENRFYKVAESFELAAKGGISNSWKTFSGIGGAAGIIALGVYFYMNTGKTLPSSPAPVAKQKEILGSTGNTENNSNPGNKEITRPEVKLAPTVASAIEKKAPVKEEIKKQVETKSPEIKKGSNEEFKSKPYEDGTSFLEIPLDGHDETSFKFNPDLNETWTVPLNGKKQAELKILDKTGREVYKVEINKGEPKSWNGTSTKGEKLESGGYIYVLNFGKGALEHGYMIIERPEDQHKHTENFIK